MSHRLVKEQLDELTALLLIAHEDGDLDEEELLLLACVAEDAAACLLPPLQFVGRKLCFDQLNEEACIRRFRFKKEQLRLLYEALEVPARFTSPIRVTWTEIGRFTCSSSSSGISCSPTWFIRRVWTFEGSAQRHIQHHARLDMGALG